MDFCNWPCMKKYVKACGKEAEFAWLGGETVALPT